MDIKWKNSVKLVTWALLLAFGFNAIITGLGNLHFAKDYFQSHEFDYEFEQFLDYLAVFELHTTSLDEAKEKITVSKADIEEHRYRYGDLTTQIKDIKNQYDYKIQEANAFGNTAIVEAYTAERDRLIEDITQNFSDDEHVLEKVKKEKEEKIEQYFKKRDEYRAEFNKYKSAYTYYVEDLETGEVFTNIKSSKQDSEASLFDSREMVLVRDLTSFNFSNRDHIFYGNLEIPSSVKRNNSLAGKIGITKEALASKAVWNKYQDYKQRQQMFIYYSGVGLLAFVLSLFLYKKLNIMSSLPLEKWNRLYRRIPIDTCLVLFVVVVIITFISLMIGSAFHFYPNSIFSFIQDKVESISLLAILLVVLMIKGKLLIARLKDSSKIKQEFQNSVVIHIYRLLQGAFLNRRVGTQVFVLLFILFFLGVIGGIALSEVYLFIPYAFLVMLAVIPLILLIAKQVGYLNKIIVHVEQLSRGESIPDLTVKGKSVLANHAENINQLNQGVKVSQIKQAKSERLKTELITNVSHDLRTPLTSIITYTELLKTPELAIEERNAYLEIIDRKSKRLKVLIDDLFEASKMASGNMELDKKQVDLVSLLQQALAEHDESIQASTLQFRVNHPNPPIHVQVDGQKIWRVFDNLISNILKYTLENTRVYISIKVEDDQVLITFKNVTKYELGENVDELLERFRRGDTSRNTEGSGLGLAIAKSIIDLHEGQFDIDLDGDLFKVTIRLGAMK